MEKKAIYQWTEMLTDLDFKGNRYYHLARPINLEVEVWSEDERGIEDYFCVWSEDFNLYAAGPDLAICRDSLKRQIVDYYKELQEHKHQKIAYTESMKSHADLVFGLVEKRVFL